MSRVLKIDGILLKRFNFFFYIFKFKLLAKSNVRGISSSAQCLGKAVNIDNLPTKTKDVINREGKVTCHNYHSLPGKCDRESEIKMN